MLFFFGTHNVTSIYRVCSLSNMVFFAFAIVLILLDHGLLAIAIARFISAIVYFIYANIEINKYDMLMHYKPELATKNKNILKSLIPNTAKLGGVTLGNFLVSKTSILIVAAYLPLTDSGSYSLTLNIFSVIMSVSLLFMTVKTPLLNTLRQEKKYGQLFIQQKKIRMLSILIGVLAFLGFIMLGKPLLIIIGSSTQLPEYKVMFAFLLLCTLEINRLISMNFIMTANQIPFLKPALLTGVSCLVMTVILFELGYSALLVPVLVQLFAQSLFNNWYWTIQEIKEFKSLMT